MNTDRRRLNRLRPAMGARVCDPQPSGESGRAQNEWERREFWTPLRLTEPRSETCGASGQCRAGGRPQGPLSARAAGTGRVANSRQSEIRSTSPRPSPHCPSRATRRGILADGHHAASVSAKCARRVAEETSWSGSGTSSPSPRSRSQRSEWLRGRRSAEGGVRCIVLLTSCGP